MVLHPELHPKTVVEFFASLPSKFCQTCGSPIQELADCYLSQCHECMDAPIRKVERSQK